MSEIAKQSVKVEMRQEELSEDARGLLEDAFYEAIDRLAPRPEQIDLLLNHFFTLRFDKVQEGRIAATLTAANKRS